MPVAKLLEHLDTMKLFIFTELEKNTWRRGLLTHRCIFLHIGLTAALQGGCLSLLALLFGRAKVKAPSESRNITKIESPF